MSVLFLLLLASTLQFYPLVCLFERVSCIPVLSEQASEVTRGTVRHTIKASLCELCVSLFLSEIDRKLQDTRWHFRTPPFLFSSEQQNRGGTQGLVMNIACPVLRSLFAFWISSRVYCRREQNTWILNRLNSSRFNYWLIVPWLCGSILAVIESITHQIICPLLSNLWFILFYFISFPPAQEEQECTVVSGYRSLVCSAHDPDVSLYHGIGFQARGVNNRWEPFVWIIPSFCLSNENRN